MTRIDVLKEAWSGFTTKSDFARLHADFVAMAASDGLISTNVPWERDIYTHRWRLTGRGLRELLKERKSHER